ncbi:MAG: amidase [Paracoccaceae bacterium]|nr:amidase [Paracoccaceae bacterium]
MESLTKTNFHSLFDLSHSFKKGDVKPSEIVELCLGNIEKLDSSLGAFQSIYSKSARLAAKASDLAFSSGHRLGPFHGIPFALKDICELKGKITTGGSALYKNRKSKETAIIASRLLAAGGILLGKTKTVEFAFGGWGTNQKMGTPKNPWDTRKKRICGGSSAGSAAAVASNMAICAVGTDTGGSVRLPAAFCGLTGLKVTKNLIPTDGIIPLSHTLDTPGPMARSLLDMIIMFEVLRGTEGWQIDRDIFSNEGIFKNLIKGVNGVRLGVINESDRQMCSTEVLRHYDEIILNLEKQGAIIHCYDPPISYLEISKKMSSLIATEAYHHHGHLYEDHKNPMDEDVRERVLSARDFSACDYMNLLDERKQAERLFLNSMLKFDALLTPTTAIEAPLVEDVDQSFSPGHFTRPFNYSGMCALSLPMGLSENGLPLSFQIASRPCYEEMVIQIGASVEKLSTTIF